MRGRDNSIDVVAGLLIVHVILGHIFQWAHMNSFYAPVNRALIFFMPWFFFKSGMYFKDKPINQVLLNTKRLLLPFAVFSLIGQFFWSIMMYVDGDREISHYLLSPFKTLFAEGAINGNLPLWFLLTLCVVQCVYSLVQSKRGLVLVVSLLVAYLLNEIGYSKPYLLANCCSGLFFYSAGHILKEYQYKTPIALLSMIIVIAILLIYPSMVDMRSNQLLCGNYLIWCLYSLAAITTINYLSRHLKFELITKPISFIGRNSMIFYVLHWIIMTIVLIICVIFNTKDLFVYFAIGANVIILPIVSHLLNSVNGGLFKTLLGIK